eukprot:Skav229672  [mRNA]  locus=scaffold4264:60358:60782:- [translate_table: standard]
MVVATRGIAILTSRAHQGEDDRRQHVRIEDCPPLPDTTHGAADLLIVFLGAGKVGPLKSHVGSHGWPCAGSQHLAVQGGVTGFPIDAPKSKLKDHITRFLERNPKDGFLAVKGIACHIKIWTCCLRKFANVDGACA